MVNLTVALVSTGGTSFRYANLTDTVFTEANLRYTDFRDANLTRAYWYGVKGLQFSA